MTGFKLLATDQSHSPLLARAPLACSHLGYTPYGHRAAAGTPPLLAFIGLRCEPGTAWSMPGNGQRVYNSNLMRFHSADRFSPFDKGGLNAYTYCAGDPVNRLDRNGNDSMRVMQQVASGGSGIISFVNALLKAAKSIEKRSSAPPDQRDSEFPFTERLGNALMFNFGLLTIASKLPGMAAATIAETTGMFSMFASVMGGAGSAGSSTGKVLQLVPTAKRTLRSARENGIHIPTLLIESLKEASGYNLIRGYESAIIPTNRQDAEQALTVNENIRGAPSPSP